MKCGQVEENFSAHYEDKLDYQTLRLFETHIAECTSCQQDWEQFRNSVKASQLLPKIEPSPNFAQNLEARLQAEQRKKITFWKQLYMVVRGQLSVISGKWAFSAALILILITASVAFLYHDNLFNREPPTSINPSYTPPSETPAQIQLGSKRFGTSDFSKPSSTQPMQQYYTLKRVSYATLSTGGGL